MSRRNLIWLFLLIIITLGGMAFYSMRPARAHQLTVAAERVNRAPAGIDDPVWLKASLIEVSVKGRDIYSDEEGFVKVRALYTRDYLYFLLKWDDPTRSVIKQSWIFDGQTWRHLQGNEDRVALLFEITRIDKFATRGCAVTCHSPADLPKKNWKLATRTAAEKGDLWHWKAARSDPYNHADDAWLTLAGNPTGSYRKTGRRKDKGSGGDVKNETSDKSGPLYMQDPRKKPSVPGFLLLEEAINITDYSIFKTGDVIPYRLPRQPTGSRFDVKAKSRYDASGWTVMLYRKLDTGHEDDVIFNPLKKYSFAIAVFDDSGADHSKATWPLTLGFER